MQTYQFAAPRAERLEARTLFAAFQPIAEYGVPRRPDSLAAGDLNGDGRADLVVTTLLEDRLIVLLNTGTGTFAAPVSLDAANPRAVGTGDFNGDGKLDVVYTTTSGRRKDGGLIILPGIGDGTFGQRQRYDLQNAGRSITTADLNGDGATDIVVALGEKIAVVLNNGNGTFARPTRSDRLGSRAPFVVVSDLNSDGAPDLAVATPRVGGVSILFNNRSAAGTPTGTFGEPVVIAAGRDPIAVAAADLNGDGKMDLAVANTGFRVSGLNVLSGNGDGTFQARNPYPTRNFSESVVTGDFDGNGTIDVLVGSAVGPYQIFNNSGAGLFTLGEEIVGGESRERGVDQTVSADFNGDTRPDVASITYRRSKITVRLTGPAAV